MIRKKLREIKIAASQPGGLKRKIKYYQFAKLARKNGVIDFRVDRIAKEYLHDYFDYQGETKETKEWGYKRGIPSYKLKYYGMTKDNYRDYISDFDFYNKENYRNRDFESWFENKLSTYYLLMPFKSNMPRHYWYARDKEFLPLDVENKKNGSVKDIMDLIKTEKVIAAKAVTGGHGIGFYKLQYDHGKFYANNSQIEESKMTELVRGLDNYIITEYVKPHKHYEELCGKDAFAVIRVLMIYDKEEGSKFTASLIRLGCKEAGVVTDYHGTIYCGLKLDNGESFKPIYREDDDTFIPCPTHPDTGKNLIGDIVPDWDELKRFVTEISEYIPMTPYLIMDIVPTDDGFSILEINSHGQLRILEPFYPFLKNKYNRKIFKIKER